MVNYSTNNSRWWLGVGKVGGEGRKGIAFSNSWYAAQLFFFLMGWTLLSTIAHKSKGLQRVGHDWATELNIVSGKNYAQMVELSKLKACLFCDPTWVSSRLFLIGLKYLFHPFGNVLALGRGALKLHQLGTDSTNLTNLSQVITQFISDSDTEHKNQ